VRALLWFLLTVALLGFIGTFYVEGSYGSRAIEVQPIRRDPHSDTGWRLTGPAQRFIGIPKSAFVTQGAPGIPPQVNVDLLRARPEVVPLDRISPTITLARLGAVLAVITACIGLAVLKRQPALKM
jgi:ABC-type Fe3+ transport system permease subunit